MGILKRIKSIVTGSINEMIDKVEDPETIVNQMIRDMEQAMTEMKTNTASAIATVKITEKKLDKAYNDQSLWQENAETSVKSGDDELAKKAIIKRKNIDDTIDILRDQLNDAEVISRKMKTELELLEEKLGEAKIKRDNLLTKRRAAETQLKLNETAEIVNSKMASLAASDSVLEGFEGFTRFEEKIERQMAEVEAREELTGDNLEIEFRKMKKDSEIEKELSELKSKFDK
ncbi:MAG: PspA/IM30 family protein [Desulfobacterales bacterium]|jgi:phage shock protein A|nr:PspA/IM30 family protein [Desulfobacteraceae bacterium]MBT4364853.1 PspA/IM30 family protein [Desulfobacteraceae bacterium]MBT7085204.1 PspA/IM30 family protein [Desulfobacterales bacterium]MBT7696605.1 PspA/IM30 family protein [Desulfobacterales bacterium]